MALNAPSTEIDPADVLRGAGWERPESVQPIEGGWDTFIWRFVSADGRAHALRLYRPGDGRVVERMHRREGAALATLARAGIPRPEVEAVGVYQGLPFFVLSWLPGRTLITVLEQQTWKLWGLGKQFGALQARLHAIPCPDDLAFESDEEWIRTALDPQIETALRTRARSTAFCHFDFHPINVMCDGQRLTGVLDFTFAGRADPRADLGRTRSLLIAAPIPPSPKKPVLQFLRRLFELAWRKGYAEEAGGFPLEPLFEAWGAATFLDNIRDAVAGGRGWGTPADIEKMSLYVEDRKRVAGISPGP